MAGKSSLRRLLQERNGRDVQEHLRELYVDRRLEDHEIAAAWGISPKTVYNWRREFGIERTDRKAAVA